jgi:hypothetical protein
VIEYAGRLIVGSQGNCNGGAMSEEETYMGRAEGGIALRVQCAVRERRSVNASKHDKKKTSTRHDGPGQGGAYSKARTQNPNHVAAKWDRVIAINP